MAQSGTARAPTLLVSIRRTLYALCSVGVVLLASRFFPFLSAEINQSPNIIKVVASDDPAPGGGVFAMGLGLGTGQPFEATGLIFAGITVPGTTPEEQAVNGQQSIFRFVGNEVSKVIGAGESTPDGGKFLILFAPSMNKRGDVAFEAGVQEGEQLSQKVFLLSGGQLSTLATVPADGVPPGGVFSASPVLNNSGEVVFTLPTSGSGVYSKQEIFRTAGGQTEKAVANEDLPSSKKESVFSQIDSNSPAILTDAGDIVFRTPDALFVAARNQKPTQIVSFGTQSPIGGTLLSSGMVSANNRGEVAFDGVTQSSAEEYIHSVFLYNKGTVLPIASSGQPSPFGGLFTYVGLSMLNDRGEIVFAGSINSKPAVGGLFPYAGGIFLYSNGQVHTVVAAGDTSPLGGVFVDPGTPRLSDTGTVYFTSGVDTDGDGNPNVRGIFAAYMNTR